MQLLSKTEHLSLFYAPNLVSLCAIWTGKINGTDFRIGADIIEMALHDHRTGKLITCSSPIHVTDPEATKYLAHQWLPRVAGRALIYWADVVPSLSRTKNASPDSGIGTVEEQHAIPGIILAQFAALDEAKAWIKTKQ